MKQTATTKTRPKPKGRPKKTNGQSAKPREDAEVLLDRLKQTAAAYAKAPQSAVERAMIPTCRQAAEAVESRANRAGGSARSRTGKVPDPQPFRRGRNGELRRPGGHGGAKRHPVRG